MRYTGRMNSSLHTLLNDTPFNTTPFNTTEARWQAVLDHDARADGVFYYGVKTTGVYCRPSCGARRPKRVNVTFFDAADHAEAHGFRACKRCRPQDNAAAQGVAGIVAAACRAIELTEMAPTVSVLATRAGLSVSHFSRAFKRQTGLTPKQYAAAWRAQQLRRSLRQEGDVTTALYAAGFGAPSRMYETSNARLGMSPKRYQKGGAGAEIFYALSSCMLGRALVAATEKGICAVLLGDDDAALTDELARLFPKAALDVADPGSDYHRWISDIVAFLDVPDGAFALPLDIQGTVFQERVWRTLMTIPAGTTVSYRELAEAIGAPRAVRAVARACASNKIAVVIPCHRVVRTDGSLSGYRWGVARKQALLDREKAAAGKR